MDAAYMNNLAYAASLTTLLGSTTAESLILGSRGAAGLPWAAMSCFGALHVMRACCAGFVPGWMRETLSLDTLTAQAILGKTRIIDSKSMLKTAADGVKGVSVRYGRRTGHSSPRIYLLYTFDDNLSGMVRSCPSFRDDSAPLVFAYARDGPKAIVKLDWVAIIVTTMKLAESVTFWRLLDWRFSVASSVTWAYFCLAAIMLQLLDLSREHQRIAMTERRQDIMAGDLPTLHGSGTEMKIILDVPINVRSHTGWKVVWAVGGVVCCASTLITFILLEGRTSTQFCIWAAFQTVWLLARYMYWHFASNTDGRPNPVIQKEVSNHKFRLLSLAGSVSRRLAQIHQRMPESYLQDCHDSYTIRTDLRPVKPTLEWRRGISSEPAVCKALSSIIDKAKCDVDVLTVIGDTMLAGISWIHGSKMSCLDLYDSCLLRLRIGQQNFLVPAARVLSGNAAVVKSPSLDAEAGAEPMFIDKLGPCRGENNGWVYWIPLDTERWLYFICDLHSLGPQSAEILSRGEVTRRLALGNLWVSVRTVEELEPFVDKAAALGDILVSEYLSEQLVEDEEEFDQRSR